MTLAKNKIKALIEATYPRKLSILFIAVLGVAMAGGSTIFDFLRGMIFTWFPSTAGMVINVIEDWERDKIKKKNEFIHKNLTKRELFFFYFFLILIAFLITINENIYLKSMIAIGIILGIIYSLSRIKLKDILLINYIVMALGYGFTATLIGWFSFTPSLSFTSVQIIVIGLTTLFLFLAVQIKDFEDLEVDKEGSTIAYHKHGQKIYILYHAIYYLLVGLLILSKTLPKKFIITFITVPYLLAFSRRFMKAKTVEEYTAMHHEHHFLMISIVLSYSMCFII